eukprot:8344933-Pyramimonas_sp.AAC.1
MISPSRCGNPSGNAWGRKKRMRTGTNWELIGSVLRPRGSFLGASWRPHGAPPDRPPNTPPGQ